jgi:tetratricopeptide (TPR) repeat protein
MNDLGVLLGDEGRFAESADVQAEACRLLTEVRGRDHPDTLLCEYNVARDWIELHRADEALALLEDIRARQVRVLGEDWVDIASVEQMMGRAKSSLGRHEEALAFYADAIARYEKKYGADHAEIAPILERKADALRALGRRDEAEAAARRAEGIRARTGHGISEESLP